MIPACGSFNLCKGTVIPASEGALGAHCALCVVGVVEVVEVVLGAHCGLSVLVEVGLSFWRRFCIIRLWRTDLASPCRPEGLGVSRHLNVGKLLKLKLSRHKLRFALAKKEVPWSVPTYY